MSLEKKLPLISLRKGDEKKNQFFPFQTRGIYFYQEDKHLYIDTYWWWIKMMQIMHIHNRFLFVFFHRLGN